MNRTLAFVAALGAGLMTSSGIAQTIGPKAAATTPVVASGPSKIAVIEYEQVAAATNEGQRALQELEKKYEPKKADLEAQSQEIDTLRKQLQSAPATMSDDDRAARTRDLDTKEKQLQRDSDDDTAAYNADVQDALSKIAKKLGPTVLKYLQENGYTILLNSTGQQGGLDVMWTVPGTDISQAIVQAYNTASGVQPPSPPPPSAPTPNRPHTPTRSTTH